MTDKPKTEETPRDKMLREFMEREVDRQIKLRQIRTPKGLAGLFPGLGKRK